ncbi:MAG: 50S ribosomal protein L30 [Varibaculum sp.]|nr:50S ribosomal protein L30 [Varibaculum sp.]
MAKELKITLDRGLVGAKPMHRKVIASLGLHRIHETVTRPDVPGVRGQVDKVRHLVSVEEVD